MYAVFVLLTLSYLGLVALALVFCYAVSLPLCRRLDRWVTGVFARRLLQIFRTYFHFRFLADPADRKKLPDRCLILANHQSLMDIPILMAHLDGARLRFVAKAELASHVPVVAPVLRSDGHCLIVRGGKSLHVMESIDRFARRVQENGWLPVIFPEGTRSRDGRLGRFHAAGVRRFLDDAPMPVAVFAMDGGWQYADLNGIIRNLRNGFYKVKLVGIFPPPSGKQEQLRVLEEAERRIAAQLDEWRKPQDEKKAVPDAGTASVP